MADEDEVDVLGDFNFENILTKNDSNIYDNGLVSQNILGGEILNCDYTIHPQWLLDKPSANPVLWYNSNIDTEKAPEVESSSNDPQTCMESSLNDESGWTAKEKHLLVRGIEIFGKNNVNLSQVIGSRTPTEVKYYLKNFYEDKNPCIGGLSEEFIFDDNCVKEEIVSSSPVEGKDELFNSDQIPASIEEVIAAVSTAKPTVLTNRKKNQSKSNLKQEKRTILKLKSQKSVMKPNSLLIKDARLKASVKRKKIKFKFKTKLPITLTKVKKSKDMDFQKTSQMKAIKEEMTSNIQIVTGNGLFVPLCKGEEVIKLSKEDNSCSDVDIEDSDEETECSKVKNGNNNMCTSTQEVTKSDEEISSPTKQASLKPISKKLPDLSTLDKTVYDKIMSLEYPTSEKLLNEHEISDVEKVLFYDFMGSESSAKTPARYLKIRNFIINRWLIDKPKYVGKTSLRAGLRKCGDVNCISKVHCYLEQVGAINFNCAQTCYFRPLFDLIAPLYKTKEKPVPITQNLIKIENLPRQRNKKKFVNDGEGGCTLTHNEKGDIINTTVINEENPVKQRSHIKKPSIQLIYCRTFKETNPQPYKLKLDLSCLILMDLHAHMYLTEVMGLVGGTWIPEDCCLRITKYIPCKNIADSTMHCDMCPITQAYAFDKFREEDLNVLGWYHSHPTFAPEPSHQDLETQVSVQQWIGVNKPCVGFILSPFSLHGALIASPYRCLIVDKKENFEDQFVPYKFKIDVQSDELYVDQLLDDAADLINYDSSASVKGKVDFKKIYFQDHSINYLEKFIYSVKMNLAKCSNVNKMTCDSIIEGLMNVCNSRT